MPISVLRKYRARSLISTVIMSYPRLNFSLPRSGNGRRIILTVVSSGSEMAVKVVGSARGKRQVAASINGGRLEVRMPGWMSQREEAAAVADMLSRLAKRTTTQHASDDQLTQRAHEHNAKHLDNRATVG